MKSKTPENAENAENPLTFWQATLSFPIQYSLDMVEKVSCIFEENGTSALIRFKTGKNPHVLEIVSPKEPDIIDIKARLLLFAELNQIENIYNDIEISIELLPDRDWLTHVHQDFPPLEIGKLFVYGSHYTETLPKDLICLQIDAATAFGSGEHGTTEGCLTALQKLLQDSHDFKAILDMGCGSGILGIAATKLWPKAEIIAVDIEKESATVTERHAMLNNCSDHMIIKDGNGYQTPIVTDKSPYDLIIANILTKPLIEMAQALSENLKSGGYCVLSGLLTRHKESVLIAHAKYGLEPIFEFEKENWQTLVLHKV